MSLASNVPKKYGRAFDTYYMDSSNPVTKPVTVRHIPIVIEGDESESRLDTREIENVPIKYSWSTYFVPPVTSSRLTNKAEDRSSLISQFSDNSVDSMKNKKIKNKMLNKGQPGNFKERISVNKERESREGKEKDVKQTMGTRKPLRDITQTRVLKTNALKHTYLPPTKYLIKTDTVGFKNCPVHGEGEKGNITVGIIQSHALGPLKAPSLIKSNNANIAKALTGKETFLLKNKRPRHSITITKKSTDMKEQKQFIRGPGQWSFRDTRSKISNDENSEETTKIEESDLSNQKFQRRWSFRSPSMSLQKSPIDITVPSQNRPISSLSRSLSEKIKLPEYFKKAENNRNEHKVSELKKCSSQVDLNSDAMKSASIKRMTPSSSTSSIPSKVSKEFDHSSAGKHPYIGILKTPGKRKLSSNNRVEFLNNIREREIPGRFCY